MKRTFIVLSLLLGVSGIIAAHEHDHKHRHMIGRKHSSHWCQQNWEKCKQFKMEKLTIRERYLAKEKECLQKAKDFWDYRECKAMSEVQKEKEMYELMQKMMRETKH